MSAHALQPLANQVLAYSDGACRGNGVADNAKGGFGTVIVLPTGEQIDICGGEPATTNNRMELLGAISALEHSPKEIPIQIWSDSSYVIKGITEWIDGWKRKNWKNVKNVDLWQRLDQATRGRIIDWQWVKGHAGHDGNEYADKLANRGIDNLPTPFVKQQVRSAKATNTDDIGKKKFNQPTYNANEPLDNAAPVTDTTLLMSNQTDYPDHAMNQDYDGYPDYDTYGDDNMGNDWILDALDSDDTTGFGVGQSATESSMATQTNASSENGASIFANFTNAQGQFVAQDEQLIAKRPRFDGNTTQPNITFVPLLPIAKHQGASNRQLILDTETTGFDAQNGDRIIEVGIVELINRRFTGEKLHVYINPHKQMDEEVIRVHGIHNAFLDGMPTFDQIGHTLYGFLQGAELIAHNANFDMNFLQAEFGRLGLPDIHHQVTVTDSLAIAKQLYAGQRNTLDALVKRLNVGKQDRTFHGALLDAEILAEVYLAMTGGQVALAIDDVVGGGISGAGEHQRFNIAVPRVHASAQDEQAHLDWLQALAGKHPQLVTNWGLTAQ